MMELLHGETERLIISVSLKLQILCLIPKVKGFRDVTIKLASSSTLHSAPDPANFSLAVSPTLCSFIDSGVAVGSLNSVLVF